MSAGAVTVYAVVYSNYHPPEVDSLWRNKEDAEAQADRLGSPFSVRQWVVE
jgi:hypothetical protein